MKQSLNHIFVAATMSAGKSSLINALMGKELLHSANEATTAKITRIYRLVDAQAASASYCKNGLVLEASMEVCPEQLKTWNRTDDIARIDITVPFADQQEKKSTGEYVIYDSPGANNSTDQRHGDIFADALKEHQNSTILYILNATQLGTQDDAEILSLVRSHLPEAILIFALNKADQLDEELGEHIAHYVDNAQHYLNTLGFQSPIIVPTMARVALLAKTILHKTPLSRREKSVLHAEVERFRMDRHRLNDAALIPRGIKHHIRQRLKQYPDIATVNNTDELIPSIHELQAFITYSGIDTIEKLITQGRRIRHQPVLYYTNMSAQQTPARAHQ